MKRGFSSNLLWWSMAPLLLVCMYFTAYVATTEVYHGQLGSTRYRIRLFRFPVHMRLFSPMLAVERRVRPANPEFSGQVHSGADLPPGEGDK
jgi:hypothetical protein